MLKAVTPTSRFLQPEHQVLLGQGRESATSQELCRRSSSLMLFHHVQHFQLSCRQHREVYEEKWQEPAVKCSAGAGNLTETGSPSIQEGLQGEGVNQFQATYPLCAPRAHAVTSTATLVTWNVTKAEGAGLAATSVPERTEQEREGPQQICSALSNRGRNHSGAPLSERKHN